MRLFTTGGEISLVLGDRENGNNVIWLLRAAVMAAVDNKCKHEEIKVNFCMGPFQTKKWWSLQVCKYNMTTTPVMHDFNTSAPVEHRCIPLSTHHHLCLRTEELKYNNMHESSNKVACYSVFKLHIWLNVTPFFAIFSSANNNIFSRFYVRIYMSLQKYLSVHKMSNCHWQIKT